MSYQAGDVFAGYTIVRLLGQGGMGSVYLAQHPRLPRRDALKLLSGSLSGDDTYRSRFAREADLAASLSHPNIVAVHDRGSEDGRLWIAMQYVDGIDASQALARGPMYAPLAAHIVGEVAAGLQYAHQRGMVHRDVKPANILLQQAPDDAEPENVLLADFGIAKMSSSSSTLTGAGSFLGSIAYAAPELINGSPADHRADVYSLGCVLFELLTARIPFPVPSPLAAITAHLSTPPPKPSSVTFGVPAALDAVVTRAMAKNPDERFQSCRDLSVAVRAAVYHQREPREDDAAEQPGHGPRPRPPYTLTVRRFGSDHTAARLGPVDTSELSEGERSSFETLLRASEFFVQPLRLPLVRNVPGDTSFELIVSGGGRERVVGFEQEGSRYPREFLTIIERMQYFAAWQSDAGAESPVSRSMPIVSPPQPTVPAGSFADAAERYVDPGRPVAAPTPVVGPRSAPMPVVGPRSAPVPVVGPRSAPVPVLGPRSAPVPVPPAGRADEASTRLVLGAGIGLSVVAAVTLLAFSNQVGLLFAVVAVTLTVYLLLRGRG